MKILLDENIDRSLKGFLSGYEVFHVKDMGWLGKKNGELLSLASGNGFTVFISNDTHIKHQQNLSKICLNFIIFKTKGNEIEFILPLIQELTIILNKIIEEKLKQSYNELY